MFDRVKLVKNFKIIRCKRRMGKIDIQSRIRSIGQRSAATVDADRDTADQVAHAHRQTRPEERVSRVVAVARVNDFGLDGVEFGREDDGHDYAVDGYDLAEDDGDEVLGSNSGGLDAAT